MKFLTFNVLYAHRGPHPWSRRKAAVLKRLLEESADIIGLQEVLPLQRGELELGLGERYQAVGIGRDADGKGEQCPIFFRKDRFAQLDWTTLWLSDTPRIAGSRKWLTLSRADGGQPALPRICTCLRLLSLKGSVLTIFNTHWDHQFPKVRIQSALLLLKEVERARVRGERVLLMGDLNATREEDSISLLEGTLLNAFPSCNPPGPAPFTYHGFKGRQAEDGCHIDYLFFGPHWKLESCRVLEQAGPEFLSDHFPVVAEAGEG